MSHNSVSGAFNQDSIINDYEDWVNDDKIIVVKRRRLLIDKVGSLSDNPVEMTSDFFKEVPIGMLSSKRGNITYASRVVRKFFGLTRLCENVRFFNPMDRGALFSSALWITLTYNPARCYWFESWMNIGVEVNRFYSFIRKKYGKFHVVRTWESFENGYVHVHLIILFDAKRFRVFRDAKGKFRVHEKHSIAEGWHSFIDVQAMDSMSSAFRYLGSYLHKAVSYKDASLKGLKTLAFCWYFKKRAFCVSGMFAEALNDLIKLVVSQTCGFVRLPDSDVVFGWVWSFRFVGVVPASVLRWKNVMFGVLSFPEFEICRDYAVVERNTFDPFAIDVSDVKNWRSFDDSLNKLDEWF